MGATLIDSQVSEDTKLRGGKNTQQEIELSSSRINTSTYKFFFFFKVWEYSIWHGTIIYLYKLNFLNTTEKDLALLITNISQNSKILAVSYWSLTFRKKKCLLKKQDKLEYGLAKEDAKLLMDKSSLLWCKGQGICWFCKTNWCSSNMQMTHVVGVKANP